MKHWPLSIVALALAGGYAAIQMRFVRAWRRVRTEVQPAATSDGLRQSWSIVVACRNEAANLPRLFASLQPQLSDRVELIVVDDHSTDATAAVARALPRARVLSMPTGGEAHAVGKKAALAHGISQARGEWIATLDGDVGVGPRWLATLDAHTTGRVALAAPVHLAHGETWFGRWQALDFCGMMLITGASLQIGSFAMGNGANLAFAKTAFDRVNGYAAETGAESASGDDMVLLGKLLERFPGRVTFVKTPAAAVVTAAQPTLRAFVLQRWRWSAKTGLNQQPALTATLALVWAYHVGLALGVPLAASGVLPRGVLATAWAVKLAADYVLLREATRHFGRVSLLDATYPLQSVAHALYVAGVGALALLPLDYEWKGRRWRV